MRLKPHLLTYFTLHISAFRGVKPYRAGKMAQRDFTGGLRPHPNADGSSILAHERQRSDIDSEELSRHLFGSTYLERQQRILSIVQQEKIFSKNVQANLSRPDRYKLGLARGKRMRQLMDKHHWDEDDLLMAEYLIDDVQPYPFAYVTIQLCHAGTDQR